LYRVSLKYEFANNHQFAYRIIGNGQNEGLTRTIRLTLNRGANAPQNQWDIIARLAIQNIIILMSYLEAHLPPECQYNALNNRSNYNDNKLKQME